MDDGSGPSGAAFEDDRDEDDEEEYEEVGGGSRLLGFMFGNVDDAGDLDVDYLDEDAKEHLSALADKLGPSFTDIDLSKSSPAHTDASEQDYDEKAEDAVDYEDIDEQYDGPEIQASTEEDLILPKKDYFSSDVLFASLEQKDSVFDEEDYDEDEETEKKNESDENKIVEVQNLHLQGEQLEISQATSPDGNLATIEAPNGNLATIESSDGNLATIESPEPDHMSFELEEFQEDSSAEQEQDDFRSETSLPVLCVEDGMVILKFSEIFGIHEPLRKTARKEHHRHSMTRERVKTMDVADNVEEDEESFLRSSHHDLSSIKYLSSSVDNASLTAEQAISDVNEQTKDSFLCAQPMKDNCRIDVSSSQPSPLSPKFYPLDQQDWEDTIIWGNSPTASRGYSDSCMISEFDTEPHSDTELQDRCTQTVITGSDDKDHNLLIDAVVVESFGSRKISSTHNQLLRSNYHPQLLRLESLQEKNDLSAEVKTEDSTEIRSCTLHRFNKLSSQNKDLLDGSWMDQIIWDPDEPISKPKLILDLQDEQMLFEISDQKDCEHLRSHAGAMVMMRPSKSTLGDSFDLHSQGISSVGRFNISNDKYYSNRKTSQQAKSHTKKRAFLGIKIMHSVPALRLQTMKPKLSNKDITNFHRPKALWYPHENKFIAKAQGMLCTSGPMKIVLTTLGGKGIKLHVSSEETLSTIKLRASKKLDFKPSEKVKVLYSGKELEDDKSLSSQNVRPNSVLHLVRTRVHLWPRAQKLPGDNKPLRPPGAFKKKTELSVKDGHVFLMEYCEERPLLLGNVGMGARLCTYYQKIALGDQTASSLRNGNSDLGTVLPLEPSDKSPFLGDIGSGCNQSCLETNMYRAPIFPHKLSSTDYLLVRSAKGMLSLRRIDKSYAVGQQEPHMEVLSPGSKNVQMYLLNRMLVHVYREFRANEKPGTLPSIRADDLASQFPGLTDAIVRKRMKHCADLRKDQYGRLTWVKRRDFRIPLEDELRRMLTPENVCSYESMQAGLYRLKHLGISRLTQPGGLFSAMNQLPDEAIALAAASHIERELQITSWNLASNFIACTNQNRENIERLAITGVGDPSGRGLGFSYVRATPNPKAPISSAVMKKKPASAKGGSTVTGTDADLRRLSMDAAREVLLKFSVPEEQIDKLTRWHRIALVRKLSSEQAASGVKVDAMTLSKFARGQRMSFLQLQQQTREKCQEIWDRQVQSLSAADGDEIDSDSDVNSDLDSFAGDLENLLDAELFEEEDDGGIDSKGDKTDAIRGFKMRKCPWQAQTEEEIEDDEAEATYIRQLLEDDDFEFMKKKNSACMEVGQNSQLVHENADSSKKASMVRHIVSTPHPDGPFALKEMREAKEVLKEKRQVDRPTRDSFVCGACGQSGHMRTNKNCPKYGEDAETSELETMSGKSYVPDVTSQLKTPNKKLISKMSTKSVEAEVPETSEKKGLKLNTKSIPLKFKCGSSEKLPDKIFPGSRDVDKLITPGAELETKRKKINKLIISTKMNLEDVQQETPKHSVVIRPIRPPVDLEKDQPFKKIVIKQPKVIHSLDQVKHGREIAISPEFRKTKRIAELSSFDNQKKPMSQWFGEADIRGKALYERRLRDEEEKRSKQRFPEESRRMFDESVHEHERLPEGRRYDEVMWGTEHQKAKKKKKKKIEFKDDYLLDHRPYRNDRRIPERDRGSKREAIVDPEQQEYAPQIKRRRGGEVVLSNILEGIVDTLRDAYEISYLFLKPVSKKEAPDYLDMIERPMDLSTVREKVRSMEYRTREEFRHDVWQITYNAHMYNDGRNPGIPPLADQLLELCDYHLEQKDYILTKAESEVEQLRQRR